MEDKKAGGFSGNLCLAVSLLGLCLVVTNMLKFVCRLRLPSPARVWTRIAHRSKVTVAALRMRAVVNTVTHYAMVRGLFRICSKCGPLHITLTPYPCDDTRTSNDPITFSTYGWGIPIGLLAERVKVYLKNKLGRSRESLE